MDNKKLIIIISLLAGGILLLVVGGFCGVLLEKKIVEPKIEKTDVLLKVLNSNLISSVTAFGQVIEISGRNITLVSSDQKLTIRIKDNAKIAVLDSQKIPTEVGIGDLKIGQNISAKLSIAQDNTLEASTVLVMPSVTVNK